MVCMYLYRMNNTATSFYKLALIAIVLSILTENCECGSFYPTFRKIRPSLTRFKTILSRNRFQNIRKFQPLHQEQQSYYGRPAPQKSTYWRYTRVQNGKIKPRYIFWRACLKRLNIKKQKNLKYSDLFSTYFLNYTWTSSKVVFKKHIYFPL